MGVNMVGYAIIDDEVVQDAAKQEIIRRYFKTYNEYKVGHTDLDTAHRVEILMKEIGVSPTDRKVVAPAIEKAEKHSCPAIAIELPDGTILTARDKNNLYAPAGVIMNAIKYLAGIDDKIKLIAPAAIEAILQLKKESLKAKSNKINLEEALIALSFSAATNPTVEFALEKLKMLSGCEAHSSVMLPESSLTIFRRLGINLTCEPVFAF